MQQLEDPYQDFSQSVRMTFRGGLQAYDAPATKAAAALVWNAGDKIYVRARAADGDVVTGVAEFRNGEWAFSYRGNLVDFVGTVQCYYFQSDFTVSNYDVTLSYKTPVFEDVDATIVADGNGGILLTTYLKPKTGRVCFGRDLPQGSTKTVARISGLSYYTSFDLKSFDFTASSAPVEQYVTSSETYFYGFFSDAENRNLTVRSAGIEFQRSFGEEVLQKGRSGYLDIPTYDAHENWEMLNYQQVETMDFTVNGVAFRMVSVPGGTFDMGGNAYSYTVTLNDYLIGQTEVTQELWHAVMGSNPSSRQGMESLPVESVSWWDCQAFIYRLNALTGRQFRLPTEAEWEYAARGAGKDSFVYSGGDNADEIGWYNSNSEGITHPVAQLAPNSLGLLDMSGNIWEWCEDWSDYSLSYPEGMSEDPRGLRFGTEVKILRGGAADTSPDAMRVLARCWQNPWSRYVDQGLRLVLSSISEPAPEPVDLGLSVRWGTLNLGAWCPEDGGDYFAWGEVFPKCAYTWENYKWMTEGNSGRTWISKYTFPDGQPYGVWYDGNVFVGDNKKELELEDDPAWQLLGAPWRMPTRGEWEELLSRSSLSWEYTEGGQGFSVYGPNGNRIFLPAFWGRAREGDMENLANASYYLSSSLGSGVDYSAGAVLNGGSFFIDPSFDRLYGYSVRPVYDPAMLTALSVMPGMLDVGNVICGNSAQLTFQVRNNSKETVSFTFEDLPGSFSISPAGAVTLGPGQSQQMVLDFAPTVAVQVDAKIRIASAALGTPLYVDLKGTGVEMGTVTTYSANGVSFNMVTMPAGSFQMGMPDFASLSPVHHVMLSEFQIGQTEVTQELWEAVMRSNPSAFPGNPNCPVENISWVDAQQFISKLNSLTGLQFRLPTEAEWEYAAREAGTSDTYYLDVNEMLNVAWFSENADRPQAVATKSGNAVGLYDMIGNVSEWCFDYYGDYPSGEETNPRGPAYANEHAFRGLSYNMSAGNPLIYRSDAYWDYGLQGIGLRLVLGGGAKAPAPEAVDIGLSVKWASFNLGAYCPSESGDYYAWGETSPGGYVFDWTNYGLLWPGGTDYTQINKYTFNDGDQSGTWYNEGVFVGDGLTVLEPEDDAAHVFWGGSWRMPTPDEFRELIYNCSWIWTSQDTMPGYLVTGPNGSSIFLPAPGFYIGSGRYDAIGGSGLYLSSCLGEYSYRSEALVFSNGAINMDRDVDRSNGCLIRPVCP